MRGERDRFQQYDDCAQWSLVVNECEDKTHGEQFHTIEKMLKWNGTLLPNQIEQI